MYLSDVNLSLTYVDDCKGKSQSHEMDIKGLDDALYVYIAGFGYDKNSSAKELSKNVSEFLLQLDEIRRQLNEIKKALDDNTYETTDL